MLPILAFMNLSPLELIVILIICLLLFGHKLPSLARSLGSSVNEFKKGARESEDEALKAQSQPQTQTTQPQPPVVQAQAASQLKCQSCGALYVPGTPGAPCPNCKSAPPPVPQNVAAEVRK